MGATAYKAVGLPRSTRLGQTFSRSLLDFINNTLLYLVVYSSIFSPSNAYKLTGIALAFLSLTRIILFRILDDFFGRLKSEYENLPQGINIIIAVFDHIPRLLFYTALFFATSELMLLGFGHDISQYATSRITHPFFIGHPSLNPFVDFLYFNLVTLSTTGFGDIYPTSQVAKLLVSSEIVFGYVLIASILASILSRSRKN
jgi:hypothetical protein